MADLIDRQAAIDAILHNQKVYSKYFGDDPVAKYTIAIIDNDAQTIVQLPSAQPDSSKYEYHYDHTDCIWYSPESRNRCPVTCAQYRDGWNDAMNYIFRDGKGYRPYRRDEQYEE